MNMSTNRLPTPKPEDQQPPVTKLVVVQTPLGMVKLAVPVSLTPDGKDPLTVAMETFQNAVDEGAEDPLAHTLMQLKQMSDAGSNQPLVMGLAILKQMADSGMLPPMAALIAGTGISPEFVSSALAQVTPERRSIFDKLETVYLN
ncbi:MAG: hypothetical protein ICCCNLDF_03031 [Planctomycetes bacterium]|nr:hypothetical protein [Planctomycetota bacterium]